MPQDVIDDDVRNLIARLEPWTVESEEPEDENGHALEAFDASLYRMAAMVAGLVSVSMTSVMAL